MILRDLLAKILSNPDISLDSKVVFDPGEREPVDATEGDEDTGERSTGVIMPAGPTEISGISINKDDEVVLTADEE